LILSGQEVTTPELGDVLVYGADVSIEKGTSLENIRRRFPDAAIIWVHPYRDENIPPPDKLSSSAYRRVEILSSNHTIAEAIEDFVTGIISSLPRLPEPIPMQSVTPDFIPQFSIILPRP
ncbi:MAG: hypothetical protein ACXU98_12090, partial [Syntrophales bacterium]